MSASCSRRQREETKITHVASRSSRLGTGGIEIILVATDMSRDDEVKRSGGAGKQVEWGRRAGGLFPGRPVELQRKSDRG
jgi:hypothetical protein